MNLILRHTVHPIRRCAVLIILVAIMGTFYLTGCTTVGPDYTPPKADVPDAWHQALTEGLSEGAATINTWWSVFDDPILDELIQKAMQGNLDLKLAWSRIEESRARLGVARGNRSPNVNAIGAVQKTRISEGINQAFKQSEDILKTN